MTAKVVTGFGSSAACAVADLLRTVICAAFAACGQAARQVVHVMAHQLVGGGGCHHGPEVPVMAGEADTCLPGRCCSLRCSLVPGDARIVVEPGHGHGQDRRGAHRRRERGHGPVAGEMFDEQALTRWQLLPPRHHSCQPEATRVTGSHRTPATPPDQDKVPGHSRALHAVPVTHLAASLARFISLCPSAPASRPSALPHPRPEPHPRGVMPVGANVLNL